VEEPKPPALQRRDVVYAENFYYSLANVLHYGLIEFGPFVAENFSLEIERITQMLSNFYLSYPENRFLITKVKMYRNIILGNYLILYRIKPDKIEVLAIYHSSVKPSKLKKLRKIKP
jgi:plasmid stabilization system protein ParE